jgi:hypothetical protein
MIEQDITPVMNVSDSSAADAAKNINLGVFTDTPPDQVKSMGPTLTDAIDKSVNFTAMPRVAQLAAQSGEHAALLKAPYAAGEDTGFGDKGPPSNDLNHLNAIESLWPQAAMAIRGSNINRELNNYYYRQAQGEKLSPDEEIKQMWLEKSLTQFNPDGEGFLQTVPSQVAAGSWDYIHGLLDNYKTIGSISAVEAGGAGAMGLLFGGPAGAAALAPGGAATGFVHGTLVAGMMDQYRQSVGQIYQTLSNSSIAGPGGSQINQNIPDDTKRAIAKGGGFLMAAVGLGAHYGIAQTVPWLKNILNPRTATKALLAPENSAMLALVKTLGQSSLIGAVGGGSQEAIKIVSEETGKSWDGTQSSLINGLLTAVREWDKNAPRVAETAVVGGLMAPTMTMAGDVMGMVKGETLGRGKTLPKETPLTPKDDATSNTSDLVGEQMKFPIDARGNQALTLQIALAQISAMSKDTNIKKLVPHQLDTFRQQVAEDHGIPHVWVNPEELTAMASTPDKAAKVRAILGDDGVAEANSPLKIDTHKFLNLVDENPEMSGLAKVEPEGLSANEYMNAFREAEAKRQTILKNAPGTSNGAIEAKVDPNSALSDQVVERIKGHETAIDFQKTQIESDEKSLQEFKGNDETQKVKLNDDKEVTRQQLEDQIVKRKKVIDDSQARIEELKKAKPNARIKDEDIFNEADYLNQPTFTKEIEGVLPKSEVDKVNAASREAREGVVKAINENASAEREQVKDVVVENAQEDEKQRELHSLQHNTDVDVVENFLGNKPVGELSENQQSLAKRGRPIFSIDPKTVPKEVMDQFKGDEALKARKVFAKGGVSGSDAATAMGVKDIGELLSILSSTPTREQSVEHAKNASLPSDEAHAEAWTDWNKTAISEAYNKMTANHLAEMKLLLDKSWSAVKAGIKRIALPLPTIDDLQIKAKDTINTTAVKDLNINQWKVGERKSQRLAVNAILDNKVEEAFTQKQNAAQNVQNAKETTIAIAKVNKATDFVVSLKSDRSQAVLDKAGALYKNAINEILDVFNFDKNQKGQSKSDSYRKFADKMASQAKGDFQIPDEVKSWLTTQTSAKDLTTEQYLYLADKMREVYTAAKFKNKLLDAHDGETTSQVADAFHELAISHPAYDETRADKGQGLISPQEKIGNWLSKAGQTVKNLQFIAFELDKGVLAGPWSELLVHRLRGIGKFENTGMGDTATTKLSASVLEEQRRLAKAYGPGFKTLGVEKVYVPEFKNVPGLKNGNLTKLDLLMGLLHMGNQENIKSKENFNVSEDTFRKVYERELPKEAFDWAQGTWNIFKSFVPRIGALEKATTGRDLDFTIPKSFEAHGQTYEGGHMPLNYLLDTSGEALRVNTAKQFQAAGTDRAVFDQADRTHDGIVTSPFTKDRVGSKWQVNLDPRMLAAGLEHVIYDLTMRVPVADTMSLLNDKSIAHDIQSIVGPDKYVTAVNAVAAATKSISATNMALDADHHRWVNGTLRTIEGAKAVDYLVGSVSSTLMHFGSYLQVLNKMGIASGGKHLIAAAAKITNPLNWQHFGEMYKFAAELSPTIESHREGIDDFTSNALMEMLPQKRLFANKGYNAAKNFQEGAIKQIFAKTIGLANLTTQMVSAIGAYNQFIAGEAPGHSIEKVTAMTDAERHSAAKAYSAEMNFTSTMAGGGLDKASIQKTYPMRLFGQFFNIARNSLNSNLQSVRNIGFDVTKSIEAAQSGDSAGSRVAFRDAGDRAARLMVLSMVGLMYKGWVHGNNPLKTDDDDPDQSLSMSQTLSRIPGFVASPKGVASLAEEAFAQHVPGVRDIINGIKWAHDKKGTAELSTLHLAAINDMMTVGKAGLDMYTNMKDGYDFSEAADAIKPAQIKALASTTGLFLGGIPVGTAAKIYKYIDQADQNGQPLAPNGKQVADGLLHTLDRFVTKNDDQKDLTEDEQIKKMWEERKTGHTQMQQAVDQAKVLRNQIAPSHVDK